jgi:hypothetical protein
VPAVGISGRKAADRWRSVRWRSWRFPQCRCRNFDRHKCDLTPPMVNYSGNTGSYTVDSSTCQNISGPAYSFGLGKHTGLATATDSAGNTSSPVATSFTVTFSPSSLQSLIVASAPTRVRRHHSIKTWPISPTPRTMAQRRACCKASPRSPYPDRQESDERPCEGLEHAGRRTPKAPGDSFGEAATLWWWSRRYAGGGQQTPNAPIGRMMGSDIGRFLSVAVMRNHQSRRLDSVSPPLHCVDAAGCLRWNRFKFDLVGPGPVGR